MTSLHMLSAHVRHTTDSDPAPPASAGRSSPAMRHWGGPVVGGFFLTMGGVHVGLVSADTDVYRRFADEALFGFVRDGWQDIFMAQPALFGLLLAAGEITLGVLLLRGGRAATVGWAGVVGLATALAAARADDVRRGVSTVGPHRDELDLTIDGMPARTHASQGEQRTLALALRLGVHELVAERTGSAPVLVLDDVLSELDARRAAALMGLLPDGQIVITTAGTIPAAAAPERVIRIEGGTIVPA